MQAKNRFIGTAINTHKFTYQSLHKNMITEQTLAKIMERLFMFNTMFNKRLSLLTLLSQFVFFLFWSSVDFWPSYLYQRSQIKSKSNKYSFNWQNTTTDTDAKVVYIIPKLLDGRRSR